MTMSMPEKPFTSFKGGLAIVTGGGAGMGRSLCKLLAAEGCSVALCDIHEGEMAATLAVCDEVGSGQVSITTHLCDVSVEEQVQRFSQEVAKRHNIKGRKVALFNNAGISTRESILGDRAAWERTFNICWFGVYFMTRTFLPLMLEASHGYVVNTSSVCGFWASIGFLQSPHTAYSAAKFAVKGFTEALMNDLKLNAPHISTAVVMPGHIGTSIAENSLSSDEVRLERARAAQRAHAVEYMRMHGDPNYEKLERTGQLRGYRNDLSKYSDEELERRHRHFTEEFRSGGLAADKAAEIILQGVREGRWRILVGHDAKILDEAIRRHPEEAYEADWGIHVMKVAKSMRKGIDTRSKL